MAQRRTNGLKTRTEEDLALQIEQLRDDVSQITETLNTLGRSKAESAAAAARNKAGEVAAAGRQQLDNLASTLGDIEAEAADRVRTKPLQSLAMAAALGLLVGLVTRRA